jgi:PRTRC genetic system protein F
VITLPMLGGVPPALVPAASDALAAKCTLALSPRGEMAPVKRGGQLLEHAALLREVTARAQALFSPLEIFRPRIHVWLGHAPSCSCHAADGEECSLWLMNADGDFWSTQWYLQPRFQDLQRHAPGLVAAALDAIARLHWYALPVYTPYMALGMASFTWWYGEMDEKEAVLNYLDADPDADPKKILAEPEKNLPFPTRAWLDKHLPREVNEFHGRARPKTIERYSHRGGTVGELARLVLEIRETAKAARRGRAKSKFSLHSSDDNDDCQCCAHTTAIRWNAEDPMSRVFDDHWHYQSESYRIEDAYGWVPFAGPQQLPAALDAIAVLVQRARLIEKAPAAHRHEEDEMKAEEPIATIQIAERPTWQLTRAVLVYEANGGHSFNPFGRDEAAPGRAYATLHRVQGARRNLRLSAGVPATREACADLARALGENAKLGGFVPQNLIYLGARSIIWWRPPGPARVFFNCTKAAAGDQRRTEGRRA